MAKDRTGANILRAIEMMVGSEGFPLDEKDLIVHFRKGCVCYTVRIDDCQIIIEEMDDFFNLEAQISPQWAIRERCIQPVKARLSDISMRYFFIKAGVAQSQARITIYAFLHKRMMSDKSDAPGIILNVLKELVSAYRQAKQVVEKYCVSPTGTQGSAQENTRQDGLEGTQAEATGPANVKGTDQESHGEDHEYDVRGLA